MMSQEKTARARTLSVTNQRLAEVELELQIAEEQYQLAKRKAYLTKELAELSALRLRDEPSLHTVQRTIKKEPALQDYSTSTTHGRRWHEPRLSNDDAYSQPSNASSHTLSRASSCLNRQGSAVGPRQNHTSLPVQSSHDAASLFWMKRDLLTHRLTPFDERPESFHVWKDCFTSIMLDLDVSPAEELDLLAKYLGPESKRYAQSLRSANIGNPQRGLQLLWKRLDERFGSPELIEACLKARLEEFPPISKDQRSLYELSDLLEEILSAKMNPVLAPLFALYDSSTGVNMVVRKLPHHLRQKWVMRAATYKSNHHVPFPPFEFFVDFVKTCATIQNDPAFNLENDKKAKPVLSRKTNLEAKSELCPIHTTARHSLLECKGFAAKSLGEKKATLKEKGVCYRCLSSTSHRAKDCNMSVKCSVCSGRHHTTMHQDRPSASLDPIEKHGGEVSAKCTTLCKGGHLSRSCGKVVKVKVFPPEKTKGIQVYAILDDQSNASLATPELMDQLGSSPSEIEYQLTSCGGTQAMSGRQLRNITVQSTDGRSLILPHVLECDTIPNDRSEIPSSEVAQHHGHLNRIRKRIPPLDKQIPIALLIGRDLPEAHHVLEQIVGPPKSPFAQRLPLGWVIIGDVCLNKVHKPSTIRVAKTSVIDGRRTIFEPCPFNLKVDVAKDVGAEVFQRTPEDDKVGLSVEDKAFFALMDEKFKLNEERRWSAPLPLRSEKPIPTCNRSQAVSRAKALEASLKKNPVKREHFFQFMEKILKSGSAEEVPQGKAGHCWYLPLFGVYHPKKPDKLRGVFDSSATFEGVSLNSLLLSGPDLTNSLLGILLRFRRDAVAIAGDIEQMFYQFFVDQEHRDLLRFFWYRGNNFDAPLVEHRMCVHVFGNSPSPAVATYGLRKSIAHSAPDVKKFVERDFYVDDGITSVPEVDQAVHLMQRTQRELQKNGGINLHKVVSNSRSVLAAFPRKELSTELQNLQPTDPLPTHGCLGLSWNLERDTFDISPQVSNGDFSRRGVLSTINGIYDPLGFLAPATISGKIFLREVSPDGKAWDKPIPDNFRHRWELWKQSLQDIKELETPRMFLPTSLTQSPDAKYHVFCDASEKAISSVAYVQVPHEQGFHLGFVMGKAKLAPFSGHTIPRLELCSAVLATEIWQLIEQELDLSSPSVTFYTDSNVVLGYIKNEKRRFFTYVTNRVERIRRLTSPDQWHHVPTNLNPADAATRRSPENLGQKLQVWLGGPSEFLQNRPTPVDLQTFPLISPDADKEIRPQVCKTEVSSKTHPSTLSSRFEKFSEWTALVRAFSTLKHISASFHSPDGTCTGWHRCAHHGGVKNNKLTENFIIHSVQATTFPEEIQCLQQGKKLSKSSQILSLCPFLDQDGLLRVGGRLREATVILGPSSTHPLIMPKNHHVTTLLVRHYHAQVNHQGRHFTEGALRSNGFWIVGAKRLVSSTIQKCFQCRRLRGRQAAQQMASLPSDRVIPSAPFSHVGVDVFGPWEVLTRKTRGGQANSKRWAVIFTCMSTRAIHIEVIEEMTSSSFINALRRFISLRGPVQELRSDRGTNFVGAAKELNMESLFKEDGLVQGHLRKSGVIWRFNPPHASHMGGVWERMIGVVRRILDSLLMDAKRKPLTHEVLCTLMAEVCAVVNSRPITPIYHEPDSPLILNPSMLLTQKSGESQPLPDYSNLKDCYKQHWKHVQVLSNAFWKKWKEEYLQELQQRRRWMQTEENLKENSLVLLRDPSVPRNSWPVGLVVRTFPTARDNLVRSVEIRVIKDNQAKLYVRPITELIPL
ncbi:uncharacterized protein [Littorina saxatilis]|uniref:uncharacterized protein n=1 Tax=Littorina saxatilis TaxID=31220 RepID=UPI0038B489D2